MFTVKRFGPGDVVTTTSGSRLGEFSQTTCYAIVNESGLCEVRNGRALFFSVKKRAQNICKLMNGESNQ